MDIKIATLVGGMDIVNQRRELLNGPALVVGTPGRVFRSHSRGNYRTEEIQTIVLDEGDHMLDLGFREELEAILNHMKMLTESGYSPQPCQNRFVNSQKII